MAILAVARDLQDLRRRMGRITAAYTRAGEPVTADDLGAAGAMTVLLKDAIKPNLIQTLEGQPCLMHAGPFANIAHGNSSLIADLLGLKLGDYVVTESGFGSDMGMEKFIDIVCRNGGMVPSAIVLVATVRALKHHGGLGRRPGARAASSAWRRSSPGSRTCSRHLGIVREFGLPAVVAVNRRPEDTDEEVELVVRLAEQAGAFAAAVSDGFAQGGKGVANLAEAVVDACEQPNEFRFLYEDEASIKEKIETIASRVYGASEVVYYLQAEDKIRAVRRPGARGASGLHGEDAALALGGPRAARRAERLPAPGSRSARLHRCRLARPALRRHPADARARQDGRGVRRRHRRRGAHRGAVLSARRRVVPRR